jgi:hypothetical protein
MDFDNFYDHYPAFEGIDTAYEATRQPGLYENELYYNLDVGDISKVRSNTCRTYQSSVHFARLHEDVDFILDAVENASADSEFSLDPWDYETPLPIPGFVEKHDDSVVLSSGVNAGYNIFLNWAKDFFCEPFDTVDVLVTGGSGTVIRTLLLIFPGRLRVHWIGDVADPDWFKEQIKNGSLKSFDIVKGPVRKYHAILCHFSLSGKEAEVSSWSKNYLNPFGVLLSIYSNVLAAHTMKTCPEFELLDAEGETVTSKICGKVFTDSAVNLRGFESGKNLVMDVGLRQLFTKDRWSKMANKRYRPYLDKTLMRYFRILVVVNKDVRMHDLEFILDTSDFTHEENTLIPYKEAKNNIDHAVALTESDVVNFFPTTNYSCKWKYDGKSAFMRVTDFGAEMVTDGETGTWVNRDIKTEKYWSYTLQYEKVNGDYLLRKLLTVNYWGLILPIPNFFKNRMLELAGARVHYDVKRFAEMSLHAGSAGHVAGYPVDGVLFEQDSTSLNNLTHSTFVDGIDVHETTLVGTTRSFKFNVTVDLPDSRGNVIEYSLRDEKPIALRVNKKKNATYRLEAIKNMALRPLILSMIPMVGRVVVPAPYDERVLKKHSVSWKHAEESMKRFEDTNPDYSSVTKKQLEDFVPATAILNLPLSDVIKLDKKTSSWEAHTMSVLHQFPILKAPTEALEFLSVISKEETAEYLEYLDGGAEEALEEPKRRAPKVVRTAATIPNLPRRAPKFL